MRIYLESSIGCSREKKERFIRLVDTLNGIYLPLLCSSAWWTPGTGSIPASTLFTHLVDALNGILASTLFTRLQYTVDSCANMSRYTYLSCLSVANTVEFGLLICNCIKRLFETCLFIEREVSARIDLILIIHKYKT